MRVSSWTDEQLRIAVTTSKCINDVLLALGLRAAGGNYSTIRRRIRHLDLDISHFEKNLNHLKALQDSNIRSSIPFEQIFCNNSRASRKTAKKYILRHNLLPQICALCSTSSTWNGKNLVLQLDHINGIFNDHRLENLRFLCPNCHSQTDTFAGKSKKKVIYKDSSWTSLDRISRRKIDHDKVHSLFSELRNYSKVARILGVSPTAICKIIKKKNKLKNVDSKVQA